MFKDRISSALPPEDNVTRPKVESVSVHAPSTTSVFCRKKWPLLVIAAILAVLMACLLPWPTHIVLTMPGAEVSEDGTVMESGEMVIDAWMFRYLFKPDEFHVTALQVPNREVGRIVRSVLSPLIHNDTLDTYFAAFTTWRTEGNAEWWPKHGNLLFTADRCSWAVILEDRIFVGSTLDDADYAAILAGFRYGNDD